MDLDLSPMADPVGAGTAALVLLHELIRTYVLAAERLHGDDTTMPVLAKGKTITVRLWAHVRDDRQTAADRLAHCREHAAALVGAFEVWMKHERPKLSRHAEVVGAMDYMLERWPAFTRFLDDGRICLTNNAAERDLRGVALGR